MTTSEKSSPMCYAARTDPGCSIKPSIPFALIYFYSLLWPLVTDQKIILSAQGCHIQFMGLEMQVIRLIETSALCVDSPFACVQQKSIKIYCPFFIYFSANKSAGYFKFNEFMSLTILFQLNFYAAARRH